MRSRLPWIIATTVLLSLSGCGGGDGPQASAPVTELKAATAGTLPAGTTLPAPESRVILRLSGVERPNVGGILELDLATFDRMPRVEATVFEPFLKHNMTFEGVLLSDLLGYAGVDAASVMRVTALDDHRVDFSLSQLDQGRVLVATHIDGVPIQIEDGGPSRFIFLDASTGLGSNTDNWIWSLADMHFETATA